MPTARKPCPVPGCPEVIPRAVTRCAMHTRPSPEARGYDAEHRRRSRVNKQRIRDGELVLCRRCDQPITDADDCDEGHDDFDRSLPSGPEHARGCNRATAGRLSRA